MSYSSIGIKSKTKEAFKKLKQDLSESIPESSFRGMSDDEVILFICHLFNTENVKLIIECKRTLINDKPNKFDISYDELIERVFKYYIEQ